MLVDVACAIVVNGYEILVTQRSEVMTLPLKWEFPGGKIKPSESAEQCIRRELMEELNIEVSIIDRLNDCQFEYSTFTINLTPFIARISGGQLFLKEHRSFQWLEPAALLQLDWAAADIPVLEQYLNSRYVTGRSI